MKLPIYSSLYVLLTVSPLAAAERYFVVHFASENGGAARRSHTFATFVKIDIGVQQKGSGPLKSKVLTPSEKAPIKMAESFTISWLPANGRIRILALPEKGRNFTLKESLDWAKDNGLKTTAVGPFEISREIHERAAKQKTRLESGQVAYKALDIRFRGGNATNCIHAVSDIIPGPLLFTGEAHGAEATALVAAHFRPHVSHSDRAHVWVIRHLDTSGTRVAVRNEPDVHEVSAPDAEP